MYIIQSAGKRLKDAFLENYQVPAECMDFIPGQRCEIETLMVTALVINYVRNLQGDRLLRLRSMTYFRRCCKLIPSPILMIC